MKHLARMVLMIGVVALCVSAASAARAGDHAGTAGQPAKPAIPAVKAHIAGQDPTGSDYCCKPPGPSGLACCDTRDCGWFDCDTLTSRSEKTYKKRGPAVR